MNIKSSELKKIFDRGIINTGNLYRLKNVMIKAESGEAISVGFIGGSITQGALSSTPQTCYAYFVYSWWKNKFPNSDVKYVNAGIGATTSQFGVARVEEDLLSHNPSIVFAEFSVNDRDNDLFMETFEGLVRKILLYDTEPALFMFNNTCYDNGVNAQRVHNRVGKYYELPIVSVKDSIYAEIVKGTIPIKDITPDNLHPNDEGHRLVAGLITNLLDHIYDTVKNKEERRIDRYLVPDKTITLNRYYTSIRHNNRNTIPIMNGFAIDRSEQNGVSDVFKNGWKADKAGASISFMFEGSFLSIQYCKYANQPAPVASLVLDQDEKNVVILDAKFDETWGNCLFLQDVMNAGNQGSHSLEITITEAVKGVDFYLAAIITA